MAKKVEGDPTPRGRQTKYPWHLWADGGTWQLVRGEDYAVSDESMRRAVHGRAVRMGITATTSIEDEGLMVKFNLPRTTKKRWVSKKLRKST